MQFHTWINLQESNLVDLYKSTVSAFPRTRFRQHATDPIKIVELTWTPFKGVNTLFIKGHAESSSGLDYKTIFLFKNINYNIDNMDPSSVVKITIGDGSVHSFQKFDENNEVLVRCSCNDFKWRWNYFDHKDHSLYGRVRKKYEAGFNPNSANPLERPGMCKHLIKSAKVILGAINAEN